MSDNANLDAALTARSATPCSSIRDRILLTLVLYAMVRAGQALAGDQAATADAKLLSDARAERPPPPSTVLPSAAAQSSAAALPSSLFSTDRAFADGEAFSATEFRPRNHSPSPAQSAASEGFGTDTPMLQGTNVWQRMTDYRSQDRVRVLTLLETRGSTLSLQAGKRGGPSLQWTSRRMNRDGGTRGLLDRWVSSALHETGNNSRPGARPSPAAPAILKPSNLSAAGGAQ
jgi:hypothetical protein